MTRVVSLVPSATETVLALDAGDMLVGISDDCRSIAGTSQVPIVSRALVASGGAPGSAPASGAEVDADVRRRLGNGEALYGLDADLLRRLAPDVVFAQDDCAVCAVHSGIAVAALAGLGLGTRTVSLDPHSVADVLSNIREIGAALGLGDAAAALSGDLAQRLEDLAARRVPRDGTTAPPRVLVLDWVEPAYVAGNWVPELVRHAGGVPVGNEDGRPSRPIDLRCLEPADAVVVAPCGIDLDAATAAAERLRGLEPGLLARDGRILAMDGRAWFSRPGPSLVQGAELLAAWLSGGALPPDAAREVLA